MLKSLKNRRNRKGFTLAELLIVVAIIAVLVAIAVPLFVGQLKDAEESVKNANIHSVRSTAVAAILSDSKFMTTSGSKEAKAWTVNAIVSKNGKMTLKSITPEESSKSAEDSCTKVTATNKTTYQSLSATEGDYVVIAYIDLVDLTTLSTGGGN